ncbi:MAG: type 1 glutamine amidotransferase domain-containing protein [Herpetosiphon sp.]
MFGWGKPKLDGTHIAILTTDAVEHTELVEPWKALRKAGATVYVISHRLGTFDTVRKLMQGDTIPIDGTVDEVQAAAFDGLYLPGSLMAMKKLKGLDESVEFVRAFRELHKPIAAISSAPALLALAGSLRGHVLTSALSARAEVQRAGAVWVDRPVVKDGLLLTARTPKDLKKFVKALVPHFARER